VKIYIISDIHLHAPGETSKGIDTLARLDLALEDLTRNHADSDLCVLLGDLADHGAEPAYRELEARLHALKVPVRVLIGNHDDRETFRSVFPHLCSEDGFVHSVHDGAQGRLIFLDTFEADFVNGHQCQTRLAWLSDRLAEARDRPVYIFMHHPPFEIGMRVDAIGMRDPAAFRACLAAHPDIRQIIAGHTHRTCSGVWRGLPFINVGATHYNQGVRFAGTPGPVPRYLFPVCTSVMLIGTDNLVIHHQDVSPTRIALAPQLFPEKRVEEIIGRGGRTNTRSPAHAERPPPSPPGAGLGTAMSARGAGKPHRRRVRCHHSARDTLKGFVDLGVCDRKRWREPDRVRSLRHQRYALLEAIFDNATAEPPPRPEFESKQQAKSPHAVDGGALLRDVGDPRHDVASAHCRAVDQPFVLDDVQGRQRRAGGERVLLVRVVAKIEIRRNIKRRI
jgi:3',5'-cyclic-AMP phosphodiesterase